MNLAHKEPFNFGNLAIWKMDKQIRLAIFASGSGTNAEKIIRYFKHHQQIKVVCVCYNRIHAGVKIKAENLGVETKYIPKDWFHDSEPFLFYLKNKKVDCIILAGFLKLVPHKIINSYPNLILNIHPALLPKYGGKGMYGDFVHEAVVANKEKETGITIHLVNEEYDKGEIIFQKKIALTNEDDANSVSQKIRTAEHQYFPQVIENFLLKKPMSLL